MIPILTGTTASGKTGAALDFARAVKKDSGKTIEIINGDSMLVYRGMDVGTAKPTAQELAEIPHHLINIRNPDEPFTAGEFYREALACITAIEGRGNSALIVGGTGFYLKTLLFGLWEAPPSDPEIRLALEKSSTPALYAELEAIDPDSAIKIGKADRYRLVRALEIFKQTGQKPSILRVQNDNKPQDPKFKLLITDRPDAELQSRIHLRTEQMLQNGFLEETKALLATYRQARALGAVGYAECVSYLEGKAPSGRKVRPGLDGLLDEIELATRQLVKRQRTFYRSFQMDVFTLEKDALALNDALRHCLCPTL